MYVGWLIGFPILAVTLILAGLIPSEFGLLAFPVWWLGGILIEAAKNKELLATLCVGVVIVSAFAVLFGETYLWTEIVQVPAWLLFLLMLSLAPRWGFTLIGVQHLCLAISRRRNT